MKKTIVKPDGSTVTLEGTPEEISEFEKKISEQEIKEEKKSKRKLLTEQQLTQIRDVMREELAQRPVINFPVNPIVPNVAPVAPWKPWEPPFWSQPSTWPADQTYIGDPPTDMLPQVICQDASSEIRLELPLPPPEYVAQVTNEVKPERVVTIQVYGGDGSEE